MEASEPSSPARADGARSSTCMSVGGEARMLVALDLGGFCIKLVNDIVCLK